MINNDLDIEHLRRELRARRRVQIPNFLQASAAARLQQCLAEEVPWSTAVHGLKDRPATPGTEEDKALMRDAWDKAKEGYHFIYDRYLMVEAMKAGRDPDLVLHKVLTFLNDRQFLDFVRYFSGDQELNMVGAQATRYRSGQFLREHDDHHREEGRRYAYVINLSLAWKADWGGLLHFTDDEGNVIDTFIPRFNSLSLFKVPALHFVEQVTPWAQEQRLAITGWWHAKHD